LLLLAGAICVHVLVLPGLLNALVGLPFALKVLISSLLLVPLGLVMGMPFPTGLRALGASVADPLVEAIAQRLPKIQVGPGSDPSAEMGPLVTQQHRDKVASYLDSGRDQGATVVTDGRETSADGGGFFLGPSLLDNVTPEMDAYRDEIFGPVLSVVRAETYDDAVRLVNENPYGNGVALFTRDGGVARQFQFDVKAGMVGVNVPIPVPVAYYSFGGWKASLFGDRHIYGPEGIDFYTRSKVVTSRWPNPATSQVDLGFPQTR
jgi:malonate-semialdehyde dehydrogenase (acetylating)/methylmalonate-semialdehyde dehydrogenase